MRPVGGKKEQFETSRIRNYKKLFSISVSVAQSHSVRDAYLASYPADS